MADLDFKEIINESDEGKSPNKTEKTETAEKPKNKGGRPKGKKDSKPRISRKTGQPVRKSPKSESTDIGNKGQPEHGKDVEKEKIKPSETRKDRTGVPHEGIPQEESINDEINRLAAEYESLNDDPDIKKEARANQNMVSGTVLLLLTDIVGCPIFCFLVNKATGKDIKTVDVKFNSEDREYLADVAEEAAKQISMDVSPIVMYGVLTLALWGAKATEL